jgi:penicillin amidase
MTDGNSSPQTIVGTPPRRPRNRRWPRILLFTALTLLVLLLAASAAAVLWLRSAAKAALPQLDGDVHLAGLSAHVLDAPVIVRRDAHGVPHIDAATQDDLFTAQGYVTAQDRLWQMDIFRRNSQGTLAEILGPSLIPHDKTQRVLQIRLVSQRIYDHLAPADRARFEDYARGVNLFIADHQNSLPVEFRLLHYHPAPWTAVDSLSVGLMMVQMLDTHAATKLGRAHVQAKLQNEKLENDLYPVGSWRDHPPTGIEVDLSAPHPQPPPSTDDEDDDEPTKTMLAPDSNLPAIMKTPGAPEPALSLSKGPSLLGTGEATNSTRVTTPGAPGPVFGTGEATNSTRVTALLALLGLPTCNGCAAGSNNWAIAGRHTASGKPLLSNDMHLGFSVPGVWYTADLRAPGFHAAGVTLPGMPFVIAGHNEHVAWGFTALMGDVQDLYEEKLDGKGNYQDLFSHWYPLTVDREIIHVRGRKDVVLDVQSTAHGPILNPILNNESQTIALKWTLYDPTLNALPLYEMNVASNWTEFSAALAQWCWPTQNLVYSDDQGHIAYHAIGRVPIRWDGTGIFDKPLPHDQFDLRFEWGLGLDLRPVYIPFDAMPNAVDPPSGFLATANSRVTTNKPYYEPISNPDSSAIPLTDEWVDPYRIERIYKSLDGRDHLTPADMLAVQTDIYSEVDQELGQRFAYAIDHTEGPAGNGDARLRQAADLMRSWDGRLTADSAAASIVTRTRSALWPMILQPKLGNTMGDYHWGESDFAEEEIVMHAKPDWLPVGYKNWDALLTAAVRKAMHDGKVPADVSAWTYGSWHKIDIEHPLARFLPIIGRIAGTGPQSIGGDTTTVKQIGSDLGPSQRFTMDWNNIDGSTENIVLGESGNPLSPYFRDQWNDWFNGTTFALPFTPAAVSAQTSHTLRLLP